MGHWSMGIVGRTTAFAASRTEADSQQTAPQRPRKIISETGGCGSRQRPHRGGLRTGGFRQSACSIGHYADIEFYLVVMYLSYAPTKPLRLLEPEVGA